MSYLTDLRDLSPKRKLYRTELMRVAELQANRLLEHAEVFGPPVPNSIVADLPKVRIDYLPGIPVSGSTHWTGQAWVIVLNKDEVRSRQRFSLAHELKHILDHPQRELTYSGTTTAARRHRIEEEMADYFAACLLMPKRMVKRALSEGMVDVATLAGLFEVSKPAMERRMRDLGLASISKSEEALV